MEGEAGRVEAIGRNRLMKWRSGEGYLTRNERGGKGKLPTDLRGGVRYHLIMESSRKMSLLEIMGRIGPTSPSVLRVIESLGN